MWMRCGCLQDSARSFAGTASDEEKYQLYMAATGFDAVMLGLAKSAQEVFDWQERLQAVREELQVRSTYPQVHRSDPIWCLHSAWPAERGSPW